MKKIALAVVAIFVVAVVAGAVLVRFLLDPEQIRQTLERQASGSLGQPVSIGGADLAFWPRAGVTLTNLTVGQPAAMTLARTEVSTAMRALLGRRIEDAEIVIENSEIDLPLALAALDRLSGPAADPAPSSSEPAGGPDLPGGVTLVNVRAIELRGVRVRAGSRSAVFSMESALDGDRLAIESAAVASDVTSLQASGTIESISARRGRLTLAAKSLDLDGLLVFAQEFAAQALPTRPDAGGGTANSAGPLDIVLEIQADEGDVADVPFTALTATAHLEPGRVGIEPMTLGLFGGSLKGSLKADLTGEEPAVAVTGALAAVDMARLTEFAGQPGAITGVLNGTLAVTGRGADAARALAAARGEGAATISDGSVKGLQLVRPIVLAFGKPDAAQPSEGGERFSRINAAYSLSGGVVTLSGLTFASRDVELDGAGTLTVDGRDLDVKANARLSKELTAQAGRDLVRYTADDGRVTVPVTIAGPVESPRVGVNVAGVAQRAVTNELKRRTETAIRDLFKRKPRPQ